MPGHQAMAGSRMPPSQVCPCRRAAGRPTRRAASASATGRCRCVKSTSVSSANFQSRQRVQTWPTLASSSSTTSPYNPRRLLPLNFFEANSGMCGKLCARYKKNGSVAILDE